MIERPAAAVKELVENALDAGARRIAVSLTGGGTERIEVADDGCGMDAADLLLAVQRHCTSKLADESLVRITTLGFRGEALPSIGAAARLQLLKIIRIPFAQFAQPPGFAATLVSNETPLPNVYLASEVTGSSSVQGAMESGENAAALIVGRGVRARGA